MHIHLIHAHPEPRSFVTAMRDTIVNEHPGLIPIGIPVLGRTCGPFAGPPCEGEERWFGRGGFQSKGQRTNNYSEFQRMVSETARDQVCYLMIYGDRKKVRRIVGKYALLKDRTPLELQRVVASH